MKEWWINSGRREKQIVILGGFFVVLFLLYIILLAPLSSLNDSLRDDIVRDKKTLAWMKEADQRIHAMEKMSQKNTSTTSSAALLSDLQKSVNESSIANNLVQLSQTENSAVQLIFQKVNFDTLIKWLIELWKKQNITVKQMTVTPNGSMGLVDATVVVG